MGRTLGKESNHSFEDYFKRATSPMLTLFLLNEKPMYVYKLSQELEKRSNKIYKMNFLYIVFRSRAMLSSILKRLLKATELVTTMLLLMKVSNISRK